MAYFEDLTPYTYCITSRAHHPNVLNVGWLDEGCEFPTGEVPGELLQVLWDRAQVLVTMMRGYHICDFCDMPSHEVPVIRHLVSEMKAGYAEIRIFGDGVVYAAPNLILHYIMDHGYKPPDAFIEAALDPRHPSGAAYIAELERWGFDYALR